MDQQGAVSLLFIIIIFWWVSGERLDVVITVGGILLILLRASKRVAEDERIELLPKFSYRPLQKGHFRLLTLHGDAPEAPIRCSLSHSLLYEAGPYEALSYVWNQRPRTDGLRVPPVSVIQVNSGSTSIQWNLASALLHLRPKDGEKRTLWIDAISINQDDNVEKNHQLALMRDIYRRASHVLAWLGESGEESDRVLRWAMRANDGEQASLSRVEPLLPNTRPSSVAEWVAAIDRGGTELDEIETSAFHKLVLRPYWERLWIVQEVALGSKVILQCGPQAVPWEGFRKLCGAIDSSPFHYIDHFSFDDSASDRYLLAKVRKRVRPLIELRRRWQQADTNGDFKLLGLVQRFRDWNCAVEVDHLFALSALINAEDAKMNKPDYFLSTKEVFGRLVTSFAESLGRLDGLNCHTGERSLNLPSWIPDFSSKNNMSSLLSTETGTENLPKEHFRASGYMAKAEVVLHRPSCNLDVRGIIFDHISDMGAVFPLKRMFTEDPTDLLKWLYQSNIVFERWRPHVYSGGLVYEEAVRRIYMADTCSTGRLSDEWYAKGRERNRVILDHVPCLFKAQVNRRPIRTSKGYIGLGPKNACRGDLVCILWGGQTPYVLRPRRLPWPKKYEFIGECYVHGIMDGEALGLMDGTDQRTFTLV